MKKQYTCVVCPEGCQITVDTDGEKILSVSGNKCKRGDNYVRQEAVDPRRSISSTAALNGGQSPVFPVKTSAPVPKDKIPEVMEEIKSVIVAVPVRAGQVIISNAAGTGADVIACANAR